MNHGIIPYVGGKHRLANRLGILLKATGADTMVDIFGGSAAVLLASGFTKRVYNDKDGDLVNLFRVLAEPVMRRALVDRLTWTPPSRKLFEDFYVTYRAHGFSFKGIMDPVQRAAATFYRHHFSFGGKVRCGGFSVSDLDCYQIKEVGRYNNAMAKIERVGEFFRHTMIECLDYMDIISTYGDRQGVVLFADPPYIGTENYYSVEFTPQDHVFLAHALATCQAHVVVTYYDCDRIRDLYPANLWERKILNATPNSQFRSGTKNKTEETVLIKRMV